MRFFLIVGALGAGLAGCASDDDGSSGGNGGYGDNDGGDGYDGGDDDPSVEDPEPIGGDDPITGDWEREPRDAHSLYVMTNSDQGNEIIALRITEQGLMRSGAFPTGGGGIRAGDLPDLAPMEDIAPLFSEGSLHQKGHFLLAVNAGSGSVSSFRRMDNGQLKLVDVQRVPGYPTSITSHGNRVFVASSGGLDQDGGISVLRMGRQGDLELEEQQLELSAPGAHPSSVLVTGDGRFLVATEVMNDIIDVWPINVRGQLGRRVETVSAGIGPLGAAAFGEGYLVVTEAAPMLMGKASLSTYRIESDGSLTVVTESLASGESATAWVEVTPRGEYAFTANTQSGTISAYALNDEGEARLLDVDAAAPGLGPIDGTLSPHGRRLYVLLNDGGGVESYIVGNTGILVEEESFSDLSLPLRAAQGILAWRNQTHSGFEAEIGDGGDFELP